MSDGLTLGERISDLRSNFKLSQTELGELIGVSRKTISSYENNHSKPTTEKILALARVFNVSYEYLVGNVDYDLTEKGLNSIFIVVGNVQYKTGDILDMLNDLGKKERFTLLSFLRLLKTDEANALFAIIEAYRLGIKQGKQG